MTNQFTLENYPAEKIRLIAALQQLSESDLLQLLQSILALQEDFQRVPLLDDGFVEEVIYTQILLNNWHEVVGRTFAIKERKATCDQLCAWDNEGGRVEYPHLASSAGYPQWCPS